MSALPESTNLSVEQYLTAERQGDLRHEYVLGNVYAMAGASERHNIIASALNHALYGQLLDRPCQVFQSDMRVRAATEIYFYPDIVVACDELLYEDVKRDTLINPMVVFEVLSPSTEDYDKGRKFTAYRKITSLRHYVLVSQSEIHVEHYALHTDMGWVLNDLTSSDDVVSLDAIACAVKLADIYRKVRFVE